MDPGKCEKVRNVVILMDLPPVLFFVDSLSSSTSAIPWLTFGATSTSKNGKGGRTNVLTQESLFSQRPGQRSYVLQTTFPVKQLADESQTLKEAGLLNSVVVQRYE